MVPVAETHGVAAQTTSPPNTLPMEYPSWARAEESDEELDTRSSKLRRRGREQTVERERRRRDGGAVAGVGGHDEGGVYFAERGLLKDITQPVVSGIFNALDPKKAKERDKEIESESEHESKKTKARPEPIQTPPPNQKTEAELPPYTSLASPTYPVSRPTSKPQEPPPPPSPTAATISSTKQPDIPQTSSTTPWKPPRPTEVMNPIESPPGDSLPQSSQTTDMKFNTLSASTSQSSQSTTASGRLLPALTAVVTVPIPALSSGARKGVEFQLTAEPIVIPSKSSSQVSPTSPASALPTLGYDDSAQEHHHEHHQDLLHPKVEKALIAVGSIGGIIIFCFLGWLFWRTYKRRHGIENSRKWPPPFPRDMSFEKPKMLVKNTLSRIPILKDHIKGKERGWTNLDHSDVGPFNEKAYVASSLGAQQPNQPAIVVQTEITRNSFHGASQPDGTSRHVPKQSVSSIEAQYNNTLGSWAQPPNPRLSDISSLSSGFGDGQFIMDAFNGINSYTMPAVETTVQAPFPVAQRESVSSHGQRRDTVYTEASEDMPPRFRTVNSWVKQQSSRVTRAKQRDQSSTPEETPPVPKLPPEQDFGLMMPDGEEPRRAESAIDHGIAS
ncbi:hypothetical protein C2857_003502 [Epichloe festucae Fl1]|uniref:Uncharacterized protein n=1 Tax=Epichloe festucae (strain Fl1) TaxID=877507 RepID=A0A7S9KKC7_EPIFF|nr:hypothetical protein C2857_003502 [Epichloe festucae Fl1]